jgi:hypothetical protein
MTQGLQVSIMYITYYWPRFDDCQSTMDNVMLTLGVGVRHKSKGCGRDTGLSFLWLKSVKARYCRELWWQGSSAANAGGLQGVYYTFLICKNLPLP